MSDERDDPTPLGAEAHDPVARLLRLAGPRPAPPAELAARVRASVHAEWRRSLRRRSAAPWAFGLALAASILLALSVSRRHPAAIPEAPRSVALLERIAGSPTGVWLLPDGSARQPARPGASVPLGVAVETGSDTRVALRLTDGPSVRVDSGSRLRMVDPATLELSHGALYVDSDPDHHAAPLVVRTPQGIARERGTQFEVRVLGPAMRVRVREGQVQLEAGGRSEQAEAGEELRTEGASLTRGRVPGAGREWSWVLEVAPPFGLEGRTLAELLRWACRENGWRLRYADSPSETAAGDVVLHGSVEGLSPQEALAAVLPTVGYAEHRDGDILVLSRTERPEAAKP